MKLEIVRDEVNRVRAKILSYFGHVHGSHETCAHTKYPALVLCGDFDFPKIDWSNNNTVLTNVNSCSAFS